MAGFTLLRPSQFLAELAHPNERNQLRLSTPRATLWIILQTSPFNYVANYPFRMAFSLPEMRFKKLACLGTPDVITVLFFRCPGSLFTMKIQMQYLPYRQ